MHKTYYIENPKFNDFLKALKKDFNVFSPVAKDPYAKEIDYSFCNLGDSESIAFNPYRTDEPLKIFFTHPQEIVADYFNQGKEQVDLGKSIIFGVKSCDLAGHKIQDYVFLEGAEVDVLYRLRRENTILVSGDCTDFKEVCHCLAWDILPHPTEGFDLNLTPLNDGYLLEVGSKRGEELINKHEEYFVAAKETQTGGRKLKRENFIERLRRHILPQNLVSKRDAQRLVKEGYALDTWQQFMLTCVECGGCNLICDTCHCFLLAEQKKQQGNSKLRYWDACQYSNFARVAGGANPLRTRTQRLRNRFMKKFDFFVDNLGIPACCGCGRCIEVCPGKIDIREVLKDLAKKNKVTT
jgi:sulfhydrogenase subunit beta (sulfur reductase)